MATTSSVTTSGQNGHRTAPSATVTAPDRTDVTITRESTSNDRTHLDGRQVDYNGHKRTDTNVSGTWPAEYDGRVRELISEAISERESRENTRANKRNFNRMLTLIGALVISTVVTYVLTSKGIPALGWHLAPWAFHLAPYSFTITLALDMGLAVYGLIKHY